MPTARILPFKRKQPQPAAPRPAPRFAAAMPATLEVLRVKVGEMLARIAR